LNQDITLLETPAVNFNFTNNNSPYSSKNKDKNENLSIVDKKLNHMSNYLRNVFFTLSLNQIQLDGLITIYEQMKLAF
jgi:hypothetical protein